MASNKIYKVHFIAGNPEMFSNVRTNDRLTKKEAAEAIEIFNRNGWRAWVENANTGERIAESEVEKQWKSKV